MIQEKKQDQLKLLNFYKAISSIATNLVGAFIPLIIYKYTGSLILGLTYLAAIYAVRLLTTVAFKKLMFKYAQLFILLRIFPIIAYSVFILLLDVNVIVGIVGTGLFVGMANAFSTLPNDLVYNYSSLNKTSSSSGITVFFEKVGVILAYIAGGLFLDYIAQWIVIVISLVLYLVSVIPLIIYFKNNKGNKEFNQEATSNAAVRFAENPDKSERGKKISKKMMWNYSIIYMLYNISSPLTSIFNLFLFIEQGTFAITGYLNATYHASVMLMSLVAGKLDQKKDLTYVVLTGFIIVGATTIALPFTTTIQWVWYLIFAVMGIAEAINHVFVIERMRMKTRILGISNEAFFHRHTGQSIGSMIAGLSGMAFGLVPAFIIIGISQIATGIYVVIHEEKSRKDLVKYLQGED